VFMLDQCHNIEPKVPGQIRSVLNVQEMTARALSVDADADSEQSRRPELGGPMTQGRNPVSALQQRLDSQRSA